TQAILTEPKKVKVVQNFSVPTTLQQLDRFLGLASYYCKFIENFSKLDTPLNLLLKKGKKFLLFTNASEIAIGAILFQKNIKSRERVISYASRTLTSAEKKSYSVTKQECLAIIWALTYFSLVMYISKEPDIIKCSESLLYDEKASATPATNIKNIRYPTIFAPDEAGVRKSTHGNSPFGFEEDIGQQVAYQKQKTTDNCFKPDTKVILEIGKIVPMSSIKVGDRICVGEKHGELEFSE
ncbi:7919_t:CDS:2, partial [Gigaspora rosea]